MSRRKLAQKLDALREQSEDALLAETDTDAGWSAYLQGRIDGIIAAQNIVEGLGHPTS